MNDGEAVYEAGTVAAVAAIQAGAGYDVTLKAALDAVTAFLPGQTDLAATMAWECVTDAGERCNMGPGSAAWMAWVKS